MNHTILYIWFKETYKNTWGKKENRKNNLGKQTKKVKETGEITTFYFIR